MQTLVNIPVSSEVPKESGLDTVVEVKNLSISLAGKNVLRDMSLSLKKGENLVILGKSGSGKSVLIKCLVRLLEADTGSVNILGKNVQNLNSRELNKMRKRIGFLFQSAALYDSMSVRENLEFPLRDLKNLKKEEIDFRVKEALNNVGLAEAIDKMPSELSGGMKKRVGLARTLILKPEIIFYDEPTTGLDPVTAKEISELIVSIQNKYKASSIIITHDKECARITANRMIMIKEGKCYVQGTFKELENAKDKWVSSFFE